MIEPAHYSLPFWGSEIMRERSNLSQRFASLSFYGYNFPSLPKDLKVKGERSGLSPPALYFLSLFAYERRAAP